MMYNGRGSSGYPYILEETLTNNLQQQFTTMT